METEHLILEPCTIRHLGRCRGNAALVRPKKQKQYYSGKKKLSTLKTQVVVNQTTGEILCTAFDKGRVHDFRLFKQQQVPLMPAQLCGSAQGYQGIAKLHFL